MKTSWFAAFMLGLVFCLGSLRAADVEILFTSGERAYGELVSQNDSDVVINRKVCTRTRVITGEVTYPRRLVASITPVTSLLDLYAQRDKATPDTYPDQFTLAKWCFERGLQDQAFQHAKHLYDEDPSDQVSQDLLKELGYVQDGGQWIKEGAFATKHGLVNFDGRWLTPAQVDLRKTDLKAAVDASNGVDHQQNLDNTVTNDQRRIKELQSRMAALNKEIAEAKQLNQANNPPPGRGQRNQAQQAPAAADTSSDDLGLEQQKKDVQKNLDSANKQLATDQAAAAASKPEVAKLQAAATEAHQAFVATLPAQTVNQPVKAAPKTGAAKPVVDGKDDDK